MQLLRPGWVQGGPPGESPVKCCPAPNTHGQRGVSTTPSTPCRAGSPPGQGPWGSELPKQVRLLSPLSRNNVPRGSLPAGLVLLWVSGWALGTRNKLLRLQKNETWQCRPGKPSWAPSPHPATPTVCQGGSLSGLIHPVSKMMLIIISTLISWLQDSALNPSLFRFM